MEKETKIIENKVKNLYMMLSFKGDFDIHRLKERHPEMYEEIMKGEKAITDKSEIDKELKGK